MLETKLEKVTIGAEVMVPRTGGGFTKGKVLAIYGDRALVSFPIGATYRGKANPYRNDDEATKIVPINELF